jgi:hypothetical protein
VTCNALAESAAHLKKVRCRGERFTLSGLAMQVDAACTGAGFASERFPATRFQVPYPSICKAVAERRGRNIPAPDKKEEDG